MSKLIPILLTINLKFSILTLDQIIILYAILIRKINIDKVFIFCKYKNYAASALIGDAFL